MCVLSCVHTIRVSKRPGYSAAELRRFAGDRALRRAQAQPKRLLSRASPSVRGGLAVAGRAARRVGHVGAGGRVARAAAGRVGLLAGGLRELLFERKQLI